MTLSFCCSQRADRVLFGAGRCRRRVAERHRYAIGGE